MGQRLDDGFPTFIEFLGNSTVDAFGIGGNLLWEKRVKPPGWMGGGGVDTTTMRNKRLRTLAPKRLKTLTEFSAVCAYDPILYDVDGFDVMIQVNQECQLRWSDESTLTFWGWLDEAEAAEITEATQPEINIKVIPGNTDEDGEESFPVFEQGANDDRWWLDFEENPFE